MDISMTSIGERIKNRRLELGLTQTDIYQACGISSGALSKIENGNRTPSVLSFYELSKVLKCSMDWLTTGFLPMSRYLKSAKKKKSFWKVSGSLEKKISMRLWKYLR